MQTPTVRVVRGHQPSAFGDCVPHRAVSRKHVCRASYKDEQRTSTVMQQIAAAAASVAISAASLVNPLPAAADLVQTVPVSQVTQMAKALPKPQIEKGKVWAVFIGGAASLFIVTVAAENNKSWFPAIARANAAMAVARKRAEAENNTPPADIIAAAEPASKDEDSSPPLEIESAALEAEIERRNALAEAEAEKAELERQSKLVEEGLRSAKKKVLEPGQPAAAGAAAAEGASSSSSGSSAAATDSSSHSSNGSGAASASSSGNSSAAGYTVVAEAGTGPEAVAWQGAEAAEPADQAQPVPAAALAGVLESRELMQQYKEQQQQQRQQEQEVRS